MSLGHHNYDFEDSSVHVDSKLHKDWSRFWIYSSDYFPFANGVCWEGHDDHFFWDDYHIRKENIENLLKYKNSKKSNFC